MMLHELKTAVFNIEALKKPENLAFFGPFSVGWDWLWQNIV